MNLQDSPIHNPFAGDNAVLTIKSFQRTEDDTDSSELNTTAKFFYKPGFNTQISYDETDDMGNVEGQTIITVLGPNLVTVQKTGFTEATMLLEEGCTHAVVYDTLLGSMEMMLSALRVKTVLDENGGTVLLQYTLNIGADYEAVNTIDISVKLKSFN